MISEDRLKKRIEIRKEQMEAGEVLMAKLRHEIKGGFIPQNPKQFADILRMVTEYGKKVGCWEECKEILEKLSEEKTMPMEKYGVECNGAHDPSKPYMAKEGSDLKCTHCGAKFAMLEVKDQLSAKNELKQGKADAKGAVERMLNM